MVLVSASFAYMAERTTQPDKFGSIPDAIWWAMATVTTVGYGDVVPRTVLGRIVGGFTMISGILMIALPVAIIGTSFAEVVRQRSFVITFGMVARIPLFADVGAQILGDILPHLRAMTIEAGTVIVEPEAGDEALYVIADGIVEVDFSRGRRRLVANDAFGIAPDPEIRWRALLGDGRDAGKAAGARPHRAAPPGDALPRACRPHEAGGADLGVSAGLTLDRLRFIVAPPGRVPPWTASGHIRLARLP
ncbi:MAG: ion channel [Bauldia sp.]